MTNQSVSPDDNTAARSENTDTVEKITSEKTSGETLGTTNPVTQIPPLRDMASLKRLQDPVKFRKAWTDQPFF